MSSAALTTKEFQLMKNYIGERCGIVIGEDQAYLIESRLSKLLSDSGLDSFEELYQIISKDRDPRIAEKIIDAITTNETLWFRDKSPWEILEDKLLPEYINGIRCGKQPKVRIWSAACSTGQEPYSIAMCIDNYLTKHCITDVTLEQFEILATDISSTVLEFAKVGKYSNIMIMRGLGQEYQDKYFQCADRLWMLDPKIKGAVQFQQFNLQRSFVLLGKFDLIFCRYVTIYFSEQLKREVLGKLADSLTREGVLFLGSSEILIDYQNLFQIEQYHEGQFYRKK